MIFFFSLKEKMKGFCYKQFIGLRVILLMCFSCKPNAVYDLTHEYNKDTVYWPTEQRYKLKLSSIDRFYDNKTGEYYEANKFCTAEHGGTHMDAPLHFVKDGKGISDIPIENLFGPAYVVDVTDYTEGNPDALITSNHIRTNERRHGNIPNNAILLLYTGWSKKWPNLTEYLGTNTTNTSLLHFPGLHPDAAQWIVDNRKVRAIGIDTISIDYGQSTTYESHKILMSAEIPVLESVKDIKQVVNKNVTVFALPLKIKGASGAPVRVIAVENSSTVKNSRFFIVFILAVVSVKAML